MCMTAVRVVLSDASLACWMQVHGLSSLSYAGRHLEAIQTNGYSLPGPFQEDHDWHSVDKLAVRMRAHLARWRPSLRNIRFESSHVDSHSSRQLSGGAPRRVTLAPTCISLRR
jgi:hypothetical protein